MYWLKLACLYAVTIWVNCLPLYSNREAFTRNKDCYELLVVCELVYPNEPKLKHKCINDCVLNEWLSSPTNPLDFPPLSPSLVNAAESSHEQQTARPMEAEPSESSEEQMYRNETIEGKKIYEGDMVLTENQVQTVYKRARKARANLNYWWPNAVVPYSIALDAEVNRRPILEAINHWMETTCLKFQPVSLNSQFPHVIFRKLQGCYSSVGREELENPVGQDISIGPGCEEVGTIVHEIGHSIGFFHEHARPDREQFVKILYNNVKPHQSTNFQVAGIKTFNIPYDLQSVMHYKPKEFSYNGKNTIVPLDPMKHFQIGQRRHLSFLDKKLANVMYKCDAHCNSYLCKNGGYRDMHCQCQCPENYSGQQCEVYLGAPKLKCGGEIRSEVTISSPNYPYPYPADSNCIWHIQVPWPQKIQIQFTDFDMRQKTDMNGFCKKDSLEIRSQSRHDGEIYCGRELYGQTITSRTNEMYVLFGTKYSGYKGFQAKIKFIRTG